MRHAWNMRQCVNTFQGGYSIMAKRKTFGIGSALTSALQQTISAASDYSGKLQLEAIPLHKIEMDPKNPREMAITAEDLKQGLSSQDPFFARKEQEKEALETMSFSIKERGVLNPVIVYRFGDKYRLVAGERRTLASYLAGQTDIPARILDKRPDEFELRQLQWIENIERKDLKLGERLNNLSMMMEAYVEKTGKELKQITGTEISEIIGCSQRQGRAYNLVLNASQELKAHIYADRISNLEKAAFIASHDISEQGPLINAVLHGDSLDSLKGLKKMNTKKPIVSTVKSKRKGRPSTTIHLGTTTSPKVAKVIFDSILKNPIVRPANNLDRSLNWLDHDSINQSFKLLIRFLEESVKE